MEKNLSRNSFVEQNKRWHCLQHPPKFLTPAGDRQSLGKEKDLSNQQPAFISTNKARAELLPGAMEIQQDYGGGKSRGERGRLKAPAKDTAGLRMITQRGHLTVVWS